MGEDSSKMGKKKKYVFDLGNISLNNCYVSKCISPFKQGNFLFSPVWIGLWGHCFLIFSTLPPHKKKLLIQKSKYKCGFILKLTSNTGRGIMSVAHVTPGIIYKYRQIIRI